MRKIVHDVIDSVSPNVVTPLLSAKYNFSLKLAQKAAGDVQFFKERANNVFLLTCSDLVSEAVLRYFIQKSAVV